LSIVLLLVVAAALGGEAGYRIAVYGPSRAALGPWIDRRPWEAIRTFDDGGLMRPVKGGRAVWRLQPGEPEIEYRLDARGFRVASTREHAAAASGCRVLALGDSHTFGYGVAATQAWPAQLETALDASGARAIVTNGGLCGSGVVAQRAWLDDALAETHPHVVVLAVTPWSLRLDLDPPPPSLASAGDHLWPRVETWLRRLARHSALVERGSRLALHGLAASVGWPPPAEVLWELVPLAEPPAAFVTRWTGVAPVVDAMVRRARAQGAAPIVLFVPLDVQVSASRNRLYRDERLPYPTYGFADVDYAHDDRYRAALAALAAEAHVVVLDATDTLRRAAESSFLADDYHLAAAGHVRVAALMAPAVAAACGHWDHVAPERETVHLDQATYAPLR